MRNQPLDETVPRPNQDEAVSWFAPSPFLPLPLPSLNCRASDPSIYLQHKSYKFCKMKTIGDVLDYFNEKVRQLGFFNFNFGIFFFFFARICWLQYVYFLTSLPVWRFRISVTCFGPKMLIASPLFSPIFSGFYRLWKPSTVSLFGKVNY